MLEFVDLPGGGVEKYAKAALVLLVLGSVLVIVFVGPCAPAKVVPAAGTTPVNPNVSSKVFTRAELAKYTGRNGRPAYVAVDGIVYDMTGSRWWANGVHSACEGESMAGQDLSDEMSEAPAGMREMLARFPVMGTMAGSNTKVPAKTTVPQKTFTASALAKYDGRNGQPAYIGADGWVYDVSASPWWAGGQHTSCRLQSMAGKDLTQQLNQAPASMRTYLQKFPVVGKMQ
jgi:predicted heme/steroid binding protein